MAADWSDIEVELIVADYFVMLQEELLGRPYNKSLFRKKLLPLLNGRSGTAVERKHQNISAVMIRLGYPWINGYKPLSAYQHKLVDAILDFLGSNAHYFDLFESFVNRKFVSEVSEVDFKTWAVDPPKFTNTAKEQKYQYYAPTKKNYIEIEQRNSSVGLCGEKLVYEYEKWRLDKAGYPKLAREVKWVSRDQGDGAGYDILSKETTGEDKYIEVKSTTLGIDTPIFFTKRENDFSVAKEEAFHLYRVFELSKDPKMFTRSGRYETFCAVEPVGFKGAF